MPEYIPPGDPGFDKLLREQFGPYVNDHFLELGLTAEENAALQAIVAAWGLAWGNYATADTAFKTALADKDARRAAGVALVRQYAQKVQSNPAVADPHRIGLGLPIRKRTRTRVGRPVSVPVMIRADARTRGVLRLFFADATTPGLRARPAGVKSCEIRQQIGGPAPSNPEAMPFLAIATRTPYRAGYEAAAMGQTVHFAFRWVNTRGVPGPWSQVFIAMVPG